MTLQQLTISDARREFKFADGVTYLNSASVGPPPLRTRKALSDFYELSATTPWRVDEVTKTAFNKLRTCGARLLNTDEDSVMYGYSTGYGIVLAAQGLKLKPGDEVIVADNDFPAGIYPWRVQEERGVKVRLAKSANGRVTVDGIRKEISSKTRVIVVSFVQFYNGYKLPLSEISELAQQCDAYFIVDGIQGFGPEPIDVTDLKIDLFTNGAQKWLLGPAGSGLMAINARMRDALGPAFANWLSVDWPNFLDLFHYDKPLFEDARRFSLGTAPMGHIVGLAESLEFLLSIGVKNIQRHTHSLIDRLISHLQSNSRFQILSPQGEDERSSIFTFTMSDYEKVFDRLIANKVICVKREGGIRISPHVYNTPGDIDRVISLL